MGASNLTGANIVLTKEKDEFQGIEDIYIGVFFDGTSNNMVQKSAYEKHSSQKKDFGVLLNWAKDDLVGSKWTRFKYESALSKILKVQEDGRKDNKKRVTDQEYLMLQRMLGCDTTFIDQIKNVNENVAFTDKEKKHRIKLSILQYLGIEDVYVNIDDISVEEMLKLINAHNRVCPQNTNAYSNVGILYSIFKFIPKKKSSIVHSIYIEGSGATDISEISHNNTNGLGFGLGKAGVVALVSKAVKYVSDFINSQNARFKSDNINIHFMVFGFSRGSTCARLFSYLIARNEKESLGRREEEFSQYYAASLFTDNRLSFLEKLPNVGNVNKTVDFLGIYDTVASIGLLKQKDGWSNPLRMGYSWASRYNDNWHYKNVTEYGLYSPSMEKVKKTCHICALDEFRENFAITDIGKRVPANGVEVFIPGCHSDIGGGYYDSDEEQEILLKKVVESGDKIENMDNEMFHVKEGSVIDKYISKSYFINDKKAVKSWVETVVNYGKNMLPSSRNNVQEKKVFFGKSFIQDRAMDSHNRLFLCLDSLSYLGWLDKAWQEERKSRQIYKGGRLVPCTIRVMDEEHSFIKKDTILFKRNIAAGYSNIPLRMMKKYAKKCLDNIGNVYDADIFLDTEYPIPIDLQDVGKEMQEMMTKDIVGKRVWLYPKDNEYRNLRLKYLHFTSTDEKLIGHFNAPWAKQSDDVRIFEGNMGNLGNTPNHDLDGQICRIVYHGDKDDYSFNYMYDLSKDVKVTVPCENVAFGK